MTFLEAQVKALNSKWKTTPCGQQSCWCLMIEPVEPIKYDGGLEEYYICGSGALHAKEAEHIVKLHNNNLRKENDKGKD